MDRRGAPRARDLEVGARGRGQERRSRARRRELDEILRHGPAALPRVRADDVERRSRWGGSRAPTRPPSPSARARGRGQLGTMVSGNHFVEVQMVDEVLDPGIAETFGLSSAARSPCSSTWPRGPGTPGLLRLRAVAGRPARALPDPRPDRQLACAPASSSEGRATSPRWPRRRTSRGRTGRRSRTAFAARSGTCSARTPSAPSSVRRRAQRRGRWRSTEACACVSTARGRHEPSPRAPTRSRPRTGRSASRSSSRSTRSWRASSLQASPPRCSARSGRRATAPDAVSPARPPGSGFTATSFAASSRRAAS